MSLLLLCITLTFASCQENKYPDLEDGVYAEFVTNKGTFVAELFYEEVPITVSSFIDLAEGDNALVDSTYKGKPFYNGLIFHRVIKNFMIQGGDPEGTGRGGPGYRFPDEFSEDLRHHSKGILSMANSGPNTNGSQFFITLVPTPHLDNRHSVFGEIVLGMDVVDAIGLLPTTPADRPEEDVVIEEVNIIYKNVSVNSFETEMEEIENRRKEKEARLDKVKQETKKELEDNIEQATAYPSGLKVYFNKKGDGAKPVEGETVAVYYAGYLTDGTLFDSNMLEVAEKYEIVDERRKAANGYVPMTVPYSLEPGLIAGFKEGMLKMNIGDVATLYIPSHLGWGEQGAGGGKIPANADVIFTIELKALDE